MSTDKVENNKVQDNSIFAPESIVDSNSPTDGYLDKTSSGSGSQEEDDISSIYSKLSTSLSEWLHPDSEHTLLDGHPLVKKSDTKRSVCWACVKVSRSLHVS